MIINNFYPMKWNPNNKQHFEKFGYTFKNNEMFLVNVFHLSKSCNLKIKVQCDYCGNIFELRFCQAIKHNKHHCNNQQCYNQFRQERYYAKTGYSHPHQNPTVIEKTKQTCRDKYGGNAPSSSKDVISKMQDTCLKKYGAKTFQQSTEGRKIFTKNARKNAQKSHNTYVQTMMEKYRVENSFQLKDVKEKIKNTNLQKYNVEYPSQSPEIRNKIEQSYEKHYGKGIKNPLQSKEVRSKIMNTLIKQSYGTNKNTSKSQERLWQLLGGELNYKVGNKYLDIAFPNEKICIEYDGGGHFVYYDEKSEQEREQFLLNLGWKLIRIKCIKNLPDDEVILKVINYYKQHLKDKIIIDLDDNVIIE